MKIAYKWSVFVLLMHFVVLQGKAQDSGASEVTLQMGHSDNIYNFQISPNKELMASTSGKNIVIWNSSMQVVKRIPFEKTLEGIGFSNDSKSLAVLSLDRVLYLINLKTFTIQKTNRIGLTKRWLGRGSSVKYLENGTILIAACDSSIKIVDSSLNIIKEYTINKNVQLGPVRISPNGKWLGVGTSSRDGFYILDSNTGDIIVHIPDLQANTFDFSPNSSIFIAGDRESKSLRIYSTPSFKEEYRSETSSYRVLFNENNSFYLASESRMSLFNLKEKTNTVILEQPYCSPDFISDGYLYLHAIEKLFRINIKTNEVQKVGHDFVYFNELAVCSDQKYLAIATYNLAAKCIGIPIIDLSNNFKASIIGLESQNTMDVKFSKDDHFIYALSFDGVLTKYSFPDGSLVAKTNSVGPRCDLIALDSKTKNVIIGTTHGIQIYDSDLKYIGHIKTQMAIIERLEINNNRIECAGKNEHVESVNPEVWDIKGNRIIEPPLFINNKSEIKFKNLTLERNVDRLSFVNSEKNVICDLFLPHSGGSIVITPDGYFTYNVDSLLDLITINKGYSVIPIGSFFDIFYRPDIISARIADGKTSNPNEQDIKKGFKSAPLVTMMIKTKDGSFREVDKLKNGDYWIENGIIRVKITAKDLGGGIQGIRLFNNGKAVGENLRGFKTVQNVNTEFVQELDVTLSDGDNILKAVGFSIEMIESFPCNAVIKYSIPQIEKPNMYILAIGINEYRNSKYNLNYCVGDANGFIEALIPKANKIFANVYVTKILNREANKATILNGLAQIKKTIKPQDVFTFFYAGHGIAMDITSESGKAQSEFFYILSEVLQMSDPEKCALEGISGSEMNKQLQEIKANKQILFVDACNSGAFTTQFAMRGAAEENALAKLSRATGSVIFASTNKDQVATEFTELKHGVFTYVLLEGLNGMGTLQNGQITAKSLMSYIEDKIPEYTKKYKGEEQWPTTFMWGQDFPIGIK